MVIAASWLLVGLGHCAYDARVGRMSLRRQRVLRRSSDGATRSVESRDVPTFIAHAIFNLVAWPVPWIVRHVAAPVHDALIARRSPMPDPLTERNSA